MRLSARLKVITGLSVLAAAAGITAAAVVDTSTPAIHAATVARATRVAGISQHTFTGSDGRRIIAFWDQRLRARTTSDSLPWVAYVHGGGWWAGSVDEPTAVAFCDRMAARGISCFSLDYTLVPHAVWPTQSDQVVQELAWVRRHGDVFHLDQRLGFAVGHSAGGLMAGIAGLGDGRMAGIVSLAGATNVPFIARQDPHLNLRRYADNLIGDAPLDSELAASASVIDHVVPSTARVPYLLVHERDDPAVGVGTSTLLAAQLRHLGFPVTLDVFPGDSHQINVEGPGVQAVDTWLQQRIDEVRAGESLTPTASEG